MFNDARLYEDGEYTLTGMFETYPYDDEAVHDCEHLDLMGVSDRMLAGVCIDCGWPVWMEE